MGRRSSMASVGTFGSVEDAKEVLRRADQAKQIIAALTEEGVRHDEELLYMLDLLEGMTERAEKSERETVEANAISATFEEENGKLRDEHRSMKEELRAARAEVALLHQQRSDLEKENVDLEQRLETLRNCLASEPGPNKLSHIFDRSHRLPYPSNSRPIRRKGNRSSGLLVENISDIYDKSEESLDALELSATGASSTPQTSRPSTTASKASAPPMEGSRTEAGGSTKAVKGEVAVSTDGSVQSGTLRVEQRTVQRRSVSEGRMKTPGPSVLKAAEYHRSMAYLRSPRPEPSWLPSGVAIAANAHTFRKETSLRPEACHYCEKKVTFGSRGFRCHDCKYLTHLECREWVPKPCVPKPAGTTHKGNLNRISLQDFVPPSRPRIPAVIIHSVLEIERRGCSEQGLYRVPGAQTKVSELLENFLGGRLPDVREVDDVQVLCSLIKSFLTRLRDPLIPVLSIRSFINALASEDPEGALDLAIVELPAANRDTLAFLIQHWQRVAAHSDHNLMTKEQLAKILGPTIAGEMPRGTSLNQALESNKALTSLMEALLSLPNEYWEAQLMLGTAHPLLSCPPSTSCSGRVITSPSVHLSTTLAGSSTITRMEPFFDRPRLSPVN